MALLDYIYLQNWGNRYFRAKMWEVGLWVSIMWVVGHWVSKLWVVGLWGQQMWDFQNHVSPPYIYMYIQITLIRTPISLQS